MTSNNSASRLLGPVLTLVATWSTKKGLASIYRKKTGSNPPGTNDAQASLIRIIGWAALSAVVLTAVDVLISRTLSAVDQAVAEKRINKSSVAVEADVTS